MTKPSYTVDICATCVTDKAPKLPLREELVSLGFEIVLNAKGIGEQTVKKITKHNWKEYKKTKKSIKKRRFLKSKAKLRDEFEERRRLEADLQAPHAVSYDNYEIELMKRNERETDDESDESSSIVSLPESSMRDRREKQRRLGRLKKEPKQKEKRVPVALPKLDFPSILPKFDKERRQSPPKDVILLPVSQPRKDSWSEESSFTRDQSTLSTHTDHFATQRVEIIRPTKREEEQHHDHTTVQTRDVKQSKQLSPKAAALLQTTPTTVQLDYSMTTEEEASDKESPNTQNPDDKGIRHQEFWFDNVRDAVFGTFNEALHVLKLDEPKPASPSQALDVFSLVSSQNMDLEKVKDIVAKEREIFMVKESSTGRLPLHQLCCKYLPDRSKLSDEEYTSALINDVMVFREALTVVVSANQNACKQTDKLKDLPAHLAARGLMEWEASWYERVYTLAATDKHEERSVEISTLYQMMSECLELLVQPIAKSKELVKLPGSVGFLLPVHIAAIFTLNVRTLRHILQQYPDGARTPCDFKDLNTFVPDASLPIELHTELSTDFPKWESEASSPVCPEISWSQNKDVKPSLDDCIRRSDLLFTFHPEVEPFRSDPERYKRFRDRLLFECQSLIDGNRKGIGRCSRLFWTWLCTSTLTVQTWSTFRQIIASTSLVTLNRLMEVKFKDDRSVFQVMDEKRYEAVHDRLVVLLSPQRERGTQDQLFIESGLLCRKLFNVHEVALPTSFLIVPGPLRQDETGTLTFVDKDGRLTSMNEWTEILTEPKTILALLHLKSSKHYAMPILDEDFDVRNQLLVHQETMLKCFGDVAYLYLIDECTGNPVLSPQKESKYPIVIKEPKNVVRTVLPLMQLGMLVMHGERALGVMRDVLVSDLVQTTLASWKDLAYMMARKSLNVEVTDAEIEIIVKIESGSDRRAVRPTLPRSGVSEWSVELAMLKMLIEQDGFELQNELRCVKYGDECLCWVVPLKSEEAPWDEQLPDGTGVPIRKLSSKFNQLSEKLGEIEDHSHADSRSAETSKYSTTSLHFMQPHEDATSLTLRYANQICSSERSLTEYSVGTLEQRESVHNDTLGRSYAIWQDLKGHLDRSDLLEDPSVTKLKNDILKEAKNLSNIRQKVARLRAAETQLHDDDETIETMPSSNAYVRQMLWRIEILESKILTNEIDLQHADIELVTLLEELQSLEDESSQRHFKHKSMLIRSRLAQAKKRILAIAGHESKRASPSPSPSPPPRSESPEPRRRISLPFRPARKSPSPTRQAPSPTLPDELAPLHFPDLDAPNRDSPFPSDESATTQSRASSKKRIDWIQYDATTGLLEL